MATAIKPNFYFINPEQKRIDIEEIKGWSLTPNFIVVKPLGSITLLTVYNRYIMAEFPDGTIRHILSEDIPCVTSYAQS